MRPDPDQIVKDANRLKTDRFSQRDAMLKKRAAERFNKTDILKDVPKAYKKTAHEPTSSIIEDEGQQIGTLVHAVPTPHIPAAKPEDELACDQMEKFLMAWWQETDAVFGPIWWQQTQSQIHNNLAVEYLGWRKVPYQRQPKPPKTTGDDIADAIATAEWGVKNEAYKRDAGVASYCDRRYVPVATFLYTGNIYNPTRVYEVKQIPERDLLDAYGVTRKQDGSFSKPAKDETTTPSGTAQDTSSSETMVNVVEYWDHEWCMIVAEQSTQKWMFGKQVQGGFVLDEWQHNWGRTPYFARPARITDQQDEDKKYAGPLDPLYTEMPLHKKLSAMSYSVAYQTAFAPLKITTKEQGETIIDDAGKMKEFLEFVPGEARQLAPGQDVAPVGQSPEVANLFAEKAASQARLEHFSLSPVAKGVSPGADTANAALSNLHRFQLSTLDPLAQQASRQASAIMRFVLERIKEMDERVYVFDSQTDSYLSLDASEVISVNVQAKVVPDQGQFQLLIEKHAMEMYLSKVITLEEMYSMMGRENPSELALNLRAERYADGLEPVVQAQMTADLGLTRFVEQMAAMAAQGGNARDAIPQIMTQIYQQNSGQEQPTGMGQGSAGQPRSPGIRAPVEDVNTSPEVAYG